MKEIKAREGCYLTQSADVAMENRVFVTAIKGANVNENDWREATAEEIEAKAQYERRMAEQMILTDNDNNDYGNEKD